MTRVHLSRTKRAKIFRDAGGICHICELRIQSGQKWDVEHVRALCLGGKDDQSNWKPAHVACHKTKTKHDIGQKSKADRQGWFHMGIRKPRTITAWRRFDGSIVRAPRERQ